MKRTAHVVIVVGWLLHTSTGAGNEDGNTEELPAAEAATHDLPAGPGRDAVIKGCAGVCHNASVLVQSYSADDWVARVNEMIGLGAQVSDEDYVPVVMYLINNFSPDTKVP